MPVVLTVTNVVATRTYGAATATTHSYDNHRLRQRRDWRPAHDDRYPGVATRARPDESRRILPGTPVQGTLKSTNYTFAFAAGSATLQSRRPTDRLGRQRSRSYGLDNPRLTYTISGFVNGETAATAACQACRSCQRRPHATVPREPMRSASSKATLAATNYTFCDDSGTSDRQSGPADRQGPRRRSDPLARPTRNPWTGTW